MSQPLAGWRARRAKALAMTSNLEYAWATPHSEAGKPMTPIVAGLFVFAMRVIDMSLDTLIPDNPNKPYDIKELIHKVVDEGDFFEIQEAHAKNIAVMAGATGSLIDEVAGRMVKEKKVPKATLEALQAKYEKLTSELEALFETLKEVDEETRNLLKGWDEESITPIIRGAIGEVRARFAFPKVDAYLTEQDEIALRIR